MTPAEHLSMERRLAASVNNMLEIILATSPSAEDEDMAGRELIILKVKIMYWLNQQLAKSGYMV